MKKMYFALVLLALGLVSCSKPLTKSDLKGDWQIVSIEGNAVSALDGEEQAHIYFFVENEEGMDNLLAAYAGCNRIGGTIVMDEQAAENLHFEYLLCTRMYCEEMETEEALNRVLELVRVAKMDKEELVLLDANGTELVRLNK